MIKHIVLFKLKEMESAEAKMSIMQEFKEALEALKEKISVLRFIEVGINCNPKEDFDIALTTEFNTMEDLAYYATHPDHVAAGKIISEVKIARSCVDYTF